jgi:hypothetical protein
MYPDNRQGKAEFAKDVLEPITQQFGYGTCTYEEYTDYGRFMYDEALVIRDIDGEICKVINVSMDSCAAMVKDLYRQFLEDL